ncbi:MAG: M23 family metallopeptidase [Gemmatimonadaceae bacterium]
MSVSGARILAELVLALSLTARALEAQTSKIEVSPARPAPGALVRLTLDGAPRSGDSVISVTGTMAGEPLHFLPAGGQTWRALGAVPVDGTDKVRARVLVERASGAVDTLRAALPVPALPPPSVTRSPQLAVPERFTKPLDSATQARIARENERARAVGSRAHESPARWTRAFLKPRTSRVTSQFGTGRAFNGAVASRHLGVDFAGPVGAPIKAANRGVVALVDTFFLAGRVIYVDHGAGVVTGYFHLSEPLVAVGDTVSRGQVIGRVGSTGRVTGPHLHWTARYGTLTMDPLDLVALEAGWYGKSDDSPGTGAGPGGSR